MGGVEPFDLLKGTKKIHLPNDALGNTLLTLFLETCYSFLAKSVAFHKESSKTKFGRNVMSFT